MKPLSTPQLRIAFIYVVVGLLWISLSDHVIAVVCQSPAAITFAQNVKGWAFIGVTGLLLYVLVKRNLEELTTANRELLQSYDQTMLGWAQLLDLRHKETKDHTERVTSMTLALARRMGIADTATLKHIERGAVLHDIGKLGVPDAILLKPDKLDADEWEQMRKHPLVGHEVLSKIKFLEPSLDIPECHHEKWDGTGYPRGLRGDAIPIAARIFAVVDVWDALLQPRVYKEAWPEEKVLQHIQAQAGLQFDPAVVSVFMEHYEQIKGSPTQSR
jgi:putative nucleotidyltransferase with HDIG domain